MGVSYREQCKAVVRYLRLERGDSEQDGLSASETHHAVRISDGFACAQPILICPTGRRLRIAVNPHA